MVEKIKMVKDEMLKRMEQAVNEKGADRVNVQEMGMLADIVKDLAEAEKECWEAEYYRSVSEAMEGPSGYMPDGSWQYDGAMRGGRMGYNPNRDSMGRYARGRRGYDGSYGYEHEPMEAIRSKMKTASPDEKERMKRELRQMVDGM